MAKEMHSDMGDKLQPTVEPLTPSDLSILHLNDDCLIKIFSYLSNYQLIDKLGTCPKFDEIIHLILRRCKNLSFSFRFFNTDFQDEKLLWAVSPHLTSVELSVGYSLSSEFVLKALRPVAHCTHLKTLTLHYVTMCDEYLQLIKQVSDHLEKIDLSYCLLTDALMGDFFENHCPSLKEVILIGNYTYVGGSLIHLKNLRSLIVESHEIFNVSFDVIKANNPKAEIVVYEKGRANTIDINT